MHIKVDKSVYIVQSGQIGDNVILNNFILHVLIHALKRFLIEVLIDVTINFRNFVQKGSFFFQNIRAIEERMKSRFNIRVTATEGIDAF